MNKFLDGNGLRYLWGKIRAEVVPATRKVCNKALSTDITLSASDVGALAQTQADDRYLQLSGGTMTGDINFNGKTIIVSQSSGGSATIQSNFQVSPKPNMTMEMYDPGIKIRGSNVDIHTKLYLNGNRICYIGAPDNDADAANKAYVDNAISTAIAGAINASY